MNGELRRARVGARGRGDYLVDRALDAVIIGIIILRPQQLIVVKRVEVDARREVKRIVLRGMGWVGGMLVKARWLACPRLATLDRIASYGVRHY